MRCVWDEYEEECAACGPSAIPPLLYAARPRFVDEGYDNGTGWSVITDYDGC